jgi:hypothetical protein
MARGTTDCPCETSGIGPLSHSNYTLELNDLGTVLWHSPSKPGAAAALDEDPAWPCCRHLRGDLAAPTVLEEEGLEVPQQPDPGISGSVVVRHPSTRPVRAAAGFDQANAGVGSRDRRLATSGRRRPLPSSAISLGPNNP